jgi:aspartate carbamoyltransferase catalytic subunit
LRGKTVVNFFVEPSTRTRSSFELAEKRLSADSLNFSTSTSSLVKGETLLDTLRNLEAMSPDFIVLRHSEAGAPHFLAKHGHTPIVNAGDGAHEHPTQALLDAFTIRRRKQRLQGLKVAIVGDILHSRVARSNVYLLTKMGATVVLCGPPTLLPRGLAELGAGVTHRMDEAIDGADVVMMLRIQHERRLFPDVARVFHVLWLGRATPEAGGVQRDRHAPGPHQPRGRDHGRRRRRRGVGHSRSGPKRRRRAHGRAVPAGRRGP